MERIIRYTSCVLALLEGSVLILPQNTGQEFDGSDSGARPDEAVSWGKIRAGSESVKVRHSRLPRVRLLKQARCTDLRRRDACIPIACRCDIRKRQYDMKTR